MPRARNLVLALVFFLPAAAAGPARNADPENPERVVQAAMSQTVDIPGQAAALVRLTWGETPADPAVAAFARTKLVEFGTYALPALRAALPRVRPEQQADVVRALIDTAATLQGRMPPDYLPAMEEATWYGTEDARRSSIPQLAKYRYVLSVLTIIDAAYEMPGLAPLCIEALGQVGDDRARFFLEKQLQEGKGEVPSAAATALARIGARALLPLKAALRSDRRPVREAAARAFIPVAGPEDASALYEYVSDHRADDAATVRAAQDAAVMLQKIQEAKEAADSSSSGSTP